MKHIAEVLDIHTQEMIARVVTASASNEYLAFAVGFERRIAISAQRLGRLYEAKQSTAIADAAELALNERLKLQAAATGQACAARVAAAAATPDGNHGEYTR